MASDYITSDMIESSEFSHLAIKYNVQGVPHTVINEESTIIGAQSEMEFARAIVNAFKKDA